MEDHAIAGWRVTRHPAGVAYASIACDCGWTAGVGPHPSLIEANEAAKAAWLEHAGSSPDP